MKSIIYGILGLLLSIAGILFAIFDAVGEAANGAIRLLNGQGAEVRGVDFAQVVGIVALVGFIASFALVIYGVVSMVRSKRKR
jgi:hypothetical protein